VFILRSETGPGVGPCHPTVPLCASILPPFDVTSGTVRPDGTFSATWASASLPNVSWWQAAVFAPNGNRVSQVELRIAGDPDGDFHVDGVDNCPNTFNPVQIDDDADGFGDACDCDDNDPTVFPGAPDDNTDGIDTNCDDAPELDGNWSGQVDVTVPTGIIGDLDCTTQLDVEIDASATPALFGIASCSVLGLPVDVEFRANSVIGPDFPITVDVPDAAVTFGAMGNAGPGVLTITGEPNGPFVFAELTPQ
jgi:hypothetical protein